MSTKYILEDQVPTKVLVARARELVSAITAKDGGASLRREFVMRIPAELDHDADLVISEMANRLEAFTSPSTDLVGALEAKIKELREMAEPGIEEEIFGLEPDEDMSSMLRAIADDLQGVISNHRGGADLAAENEKLLAAAVIFYGCLKDLEELGATVAVCGVDPEVVRIIESRIATECGEISTCLKCGHEQPLKSQFDPCDACGHTWGSLSKQTNTALLDQMAELLADSKCIPCDVEPTTVPCDHCNRKKELLALYHQSKRGEEDA